MAIRDLLTTHTSPFLPYVSVRHVPARMTMSQPVNVVILNHSAEFISVSLDRTSRRVISNLDYQKWGL